MSSKPAPLRQRRSTMRIQSSWRPGERTPAWDALWARIISDVAPQLLEEAQLAEEAQGHE